MNIRCIYLEHLNFNKLIVLNKKVYIVKMPSVIDMFYQRYLNMILLSLKQKKVLYFYQNLTSSTKF